jgi:hypothetical protein
MGSHPVAATTDVEHGGVEEEAVDDSCGDHLVSEDLTPIGEPAVGGKDDGAFVIAAGDGVVSCSERAKRASSPTAVSALPLAAARSLADFLDRERLTVSRGPTFCAPIRRMPHDARVWTVRLGHLWLNDCVTSLFPTCQA